GVCSQYSSIVPIGVDGAAVGPVLMYLDTRGTDHCWAIMERHPDAFTTFVERHGIPPIGGGLSLAHLLHLQLDEPAVHDRTAVHLEVMDLVNLRLTGRAVATQCTAFASQLCDNRTVGVTDYDPELLRLSGLDVDRLPSLIGIDDVVGTVPDALAQDLGLPRGVEVRAGMNDTQAGAFATGLFASLGSASGPGEHCAGVVVGTTAVLIDTAPVHAVDLEHEVLTMPAPLAGRHLVMAENGIAGRAVEHVLGLLSPASTGPGTAAADPFAELDGALARSAPGAGGLLFLPWLAGSMSPRADAAMRGGFVNLSLTTTRDDLLRSVLEGTAHNLAWLLPAVEALAGRPADRLVFAGGAARSPAWAQVLADVTDRPVDVLERPELAAATAVGAVALRRRLGEDPGAIGLPVASRHEPAEAAAAVHAAAQEHFEAAFEATAPICQALGHE
ncbi:MAG: FGGY-family carbohydrate kinase, partial [Microthrixaceae bacterium]